MLALVSKPIRWKHKPPGGARRSALGLGSLTAAMRARGTGGGAGSVSARPGAGGTAPRSSRPAGTLLGLCQRAAEEIETPR